MRSSDAAQPYGQQGVRGSSPRETEGRALLESARRMSEAIRTPEDTANMLVTARLNWRLWTIFQADLSDETSEIPADVRVNMLNLCNFVDKQTVDILAEPQPSKFKVLINVNRQIAAGLLTDPRQQQPDQPATEDTAPEDPTGGGISV